MGFLDFLSGKKKSSAPTDQPPAAPAAPAPPPSAWQAQLQAAQKADFHWDFKNAAARALVTQLLAQAAPVFGAGHVKEMPDDDAIELRGTFDGAPIKIVVSMDFGSINKFEVMCDNRIGYFILHRDHEKIPQPGDNADPWSAGDERRIFIAKGIFVEGSDAAVAEALARWSALPGPVQAHVLAGMEQLGLYMITVMPKNVMLVRGESLKNLDDPIAYMQTGARMIADLASAVGHGAPVGAVAAGPAVVAVAAGPAVVAAPAVDLTPITCKFCSSLFILTLGHTSCPNCGAPATR